MPWTIGPATPDDADGIAELNAVVQRLHHEQLPHLFKEPDDAALAPVMRAWLGEPAVQAFIARDGDGSPIGYAVAVRHERPATPFRRAATFVELDQIAVADDARRSGVGAALAAAVLAWAGASGAQRVQLSTWEFNAGAHRFFEALGFSTVLRWMSREVPPP